MTTEKTIERTLKSGRKVKQPASPPVASASKQKFEERRKPYRREGEKFVFGPGGDPYLQPLPPEPAPPVVPDALSLDSIPWSEVSELLQEYPKMKRNSQGIAFSGTYIKLRLKDDTFVEGWLDEVGHKRFKKEGALSGWRSPGRR